MGEEKSKSQTDQYLEGILNRPESKVEREYKETCTRNVELVVIPKPVACPKCKQSMILDAQVVFPARYEWNVRELMWQLMNYDTPPEGCSNVTMQWEEITYICNRCKSTRKYDQRQ